jgi:antitoxin component YwqK of YwqJK toxin-antitoxin module
VLHGCFKKYFFGRLDLKKYYNNGVMDGESISYHSNKKIKEISHYKNGLCHGENKKWNEDGKLIKSCIYKNGKTDKRKIKYH